MNRFTISETPLAGLKVIERQRLTDARGFLSRLFCSEEFATFGWTKPIAQINQTSTFRKGTIRGFHFQHPPNSEMKLVSCLRGEVWDVAVDIRVDSPTFLHWYGTCLSAENCLGLMIPEGFAHGFQTLTDDVLLFYLHSSAHFPGTDGGLNVQDPQLGISWPLSITEISDRDKSHPLIKKSFKGVRP